MGSKRTTTAAAAVSDSEGRAWAPGARSIRTPVPIGPREDGGLGTIALWNKLGGRNLFIAGSIGSGKTNVLNVFLAGLAASRDTVVWVIDVAKRGKSLAPWLPCIDWLVTDPDDAVTMLTAVNRIIDARALIGARLAATGTGDAVMQPSRELPLLIVVIDEASALFGRSTPAAALATEAATQVAETDRECAVSMIVSTQKPTQDSLGHSGRLKAQLNPTIALRMNRQSDLRWALSNARPEDLNLAVYSAPGVLLVQDGADTSPLPVRSYALYDPAIVARLAAVYAPHRPTLDAASAAAAGTDYTGRNRDPLGLTTTATATSRDHTDKATTGDYTPRTAAKTSGPKTTRASLAEARAKAVSLIDAATGQPVLPAVALTQLTIGQPPPQGDPAATAAILTVITAAPRGVTRTQLQAATGVSKTTACRVLAALVAAGDITKDTTTVPPTYRPAGHGR